MVVNEEQYWELVQFIDNSDEEILGFEMEDFEESDFPDVCQILRRLQGDVCAQVNFKVFLCPDCGRLHGLFEVIKEDN